MNRLKCERQRFRESSTDYFSNCKEMIAESNLILLRKGTRISLILLLLYALLVIPMFQSVMLIAIYLIFIIADFLMTVYAFYFLSKRACTYASVQRACRLFVFLFLSFVLLISVFPFPDQPGIFYPIFALVVMQLFILPLWQISLLTLSMTGVYLLLCWEFKDGDSFSYDWFGTMTAFILGMALSYMTLTSHIREGVTQRDLQIVSSTDVMTGLPNRRAFDLFLEKNLRKCGQKGWPMAVFMADIDNFKQYNDTFGHLAGDHCLRRLGGALLRLANDEGLFVARYGGEELVVILLDEQVMEIERYAEAVMECVRTTTVSDGEARTDAGGFSSGRVTISMGIAVADSDSKAYESLMERADQALYRAKREGKNQIVYAD